MALSARHDVLAKAGTAIAVLVLAQTFQQQAGAQDFRPGTMAMLPPYCMYAQGYRENVPGGNDPVHIKHWYTVLGQNFHNMHHYCRGLTFMNNAKLQSLPPQQRKHLYSAASNEIAYVIARAPAGYVLLPELLTRRGEAYIGAGNLQLGLVDLTTATQMKSDYWPAYAALADVFTRIGQPAKAREWLAQGLSHSPDSKTLQQKWAELDAAQGGKRTPLPAPVAKSPAAGPSSSTRANTGAVDGSALSAPEAGTSPEPDESSAPATRP